MQKDDNYVVGPIASAIEAAKARHRAQLVPDYISSDVHEIREKFRLGLKIEDAERRGQSFDPFEQETGSGPATSVPTPSPKPPSLVAPQPPVGSPRDSARRPGRAVAESGSPRPTISRQGSGMPPPAFSREAHPEGGSDHLRAYRFESSWFQVNPEVLLGSDQLAAAQEAAVLDPLHNDVQGVHVNALRELRAQASQRAAAEDAEARDKMSPAALEAHRIANIKKKESLQRRASESGAGAGSAPAKVVDLEPPSRTTVLSRIERRFSTSGGGMGAIPSGVNSPSVGLSPRTSVALPSAGALTQEPVPVSALRAGLLGSASLQSRSGRFSEGGGALSLDGPGVPRPQSPASGRGFVRPLRSTMLARGSSVGSEGGASLPSPHEPPARSPLGQGPASPDWDAHMQFAGSEPGSAPGSEIPSPDAGAGAAAAAAPASGIAPQTMARMASASRRSSWAGQAPSDDRPSGQRSLSRRGSMSGGPGSKLPGGGGASSAGLSLAVGAALGAPGIISGALARTTSGMKRV